MTPVPRDQQERFLRQIVPAAAQVCPQFGLDPKACIMAAALQSSCGRFALGFNWWSLRGNGDAALKAFEDAVKVHPRMEGMPALIRDLKQRVRGQEL